MKFKIKTCTRCGKEFKPNSNFQTYCSECASINNREKHREWLKKHSSKVKESRKQYYLMHTEREKENHRQYMLTHPAIGEYERQYSKLYRQTESGKENLGKSKSKRRSLGFIPLNSFHKGDEFHHQDKMGYGIYMDKEAHKSIYHNIFTGKGMDEMNALAWNYLGDVNL
jgi:hypothetical protein